MMTDIYFWVNYPVTVHVERSKSVISEVPFQLECCLRIEGSCPCMSVFGTEPLIQTDIDLKFFRIVCLQW